MTSTIYFHYNARRVFTATRWAICSSGLFDHISADEHLLYIKASRGLPILGEDIRLRIVATGPDEASVEITSSDKLLYNIFKWGNNKRNIKEVASLVQNEIYRYLATEFVPNENSVIRIAQPEIKIRK